MNVFILITTGRIAKVIRNIVNYECPPCPWITGYLAIIVGLALTFLVQSSSVFTAALTPLVGIGVVSLELMYPLTLGANIGTTTTAIIASFASANEGKEKAFKSSLQVSTQYLNPYNLLTQKYLESSLTFDIV